MAGNGFRNAMKKINAGTAFQVSAGKSTSDTDGTTTKTNTMTPKTPKTPKTPVSNTKVKNESTDDSAGTDDNEPTSPSTKNAGTDVDNPLTPHTPATPVSGKKRPAKTAADDGSPEKPKRVRKAAEPKVDENGNPIPRAKPGRKPKVDEEGNPVNPVRVRKPTKAQMEKQAAADKEADEKKEAEEAKAKEMGVLKTVDGVLTGKANWVNDFTPINGQGQGKDVAIEEDKGDGEAVKEEQMDDAETSDPLGEAGQEV